MVSSKNEITITILGSGTCVPSLARSSCSVLMEIKNKKLLFDCGPGTMRRLLEAGTNIFDISFLFLSHFHPDHSGELVPFLFSNKYSNQNQRLFPLTLVAGKGINDFFKGLKKVYGSWIQLREELFKIIEMNSLRGDEFQASNLRIESMPVEHNDESIAFRVTGPENISVVYSGDTDFSEDLIILSKNADLLICESALPDNMKAGGHMTPSLAGEIAARANVRKLVLTHFYPECDQADIEKECRKTYSGPLILAEDLMKIKV